MATDEDLAGIRARIDAIDSREALATLFAQPGFASPFGGYVFVDDKNPDVNMMQMGLSRLGLPDRDYYLKDDEASVALQTAYVTMLTTLFTAAGDEDAEGGSFFPTGGSAPLPKTLSSSFFSSNDTWALFCF